MVINRVAAFLKGERKTFGQVNESVATATSGNQFNKTETAATVLDRDLAGIEVLPEYLEVKELIENSFPLIFVTGGAGTGKSTFIRWLDNEFRGQTLLCAPTGIAALTIAGKTIHSLCKFPPSWIVREDIKLAPQSLAKHTKILIIDEISMVNANLLDAMNIFFQKNRDNAKPFGGVSVVMVGDLFQLPPIVTSVTKPLFSTNYKSPMFFSANAIENSEFFSVELTKAFRQVDQDFVDLLSNIREGKEVEKTLETLNGACKITDTPAPGTISLSPRHADVERTNSERLAKLPGNIKTFHGRTTGKFHEKHLPVPISLNLKVGAQVMLAKNSKHYVNGDIATVVEIFPDRIKALMLRNDKVIEVPIAIWEQFDYRFNVETQEINRVVVGSYEQLPVVLAWAMTIHRCQGLTLERVHIDLGQGAFETGQTYVALSRCRSIATLSLTRPVRADDIRVDPKATAFYAELRK